MKKKSLSLFLAAAMVLTMTASPVFAAEEDPQGGETGEAVQEDTSEAQEPEPASGMLTITFNEEEPYVLEPRTTLNTVRMDPDSYDGVGNLKKPGDETKEGSTNYVWPKDETGVKSLPEGRTPNMNTFVIDNNLARKYSTIILTGETSQYRVRVETTKPVTLVLDYLHITTQSGRIWEEKINELGHPTYTLHDSTKTPYLDNRIYYSPIDMGDGADVTVKVEGSNSLTVAALDGGESGDSCDYFATNLTDPAIHVASGNLTIGGTGSLSLEQQNVAEDAIGGAALIGTARGESLSGSITIGESAQVTASANGGGAAIGSGAGGNMTNSDSITIQDSAKVSATVNGGGAAIGTGTGTDSGGGKIEISATEPGSNLTVNATANGGGAAIGSGQYGDMAGSGMIRISNGGGDDKNQNSDFSPQIEAHVDHGAAAVIGCGEEGSMEDGLAEIVIEGTADIELWENENSREGYVPGTAIGVGGYPEGGDPTIISDDRNQGSVAIDISNDESSGGGGEADIMPSITMHGNGWIGLTGGQEHDAVQIDSAVERETLPYTAQEEPQEPAAPSGSGGGTVPSVTSSRVAGDDRFETAIEVADKLKSQLGVVKFNNIIVANSDEFADALSAAALAADKDAPVLLVNENNESAVKRYIADNLNKGGKVYIIGGTAVVSEGFEKSLTGCKVTRLGGADRYETNLEVLKSLDLKGASDIMVASGFLYPDALSASATGNPVLLVGKALTGNQKEYLKTLGGDDDYYVIGGTTAVNEDVARAVGVYGSVTRLGGDTRYETGLAVAEEFFENARTVVIASGDDFPDGLTGGVLANAMNAPLLLVNRYNTDIAADFVDDNGVRRVIAIGGTAAISEETLNKVA